MKGMKLKLKDYMSHIYKANQCTDIIDINYALSSCRELRLIFGDEKVIIRRMVSLHNKKIKLEKN